MPGLRGVGWGQGLADGCGCCTRLLPHHAQVCFDPADVASCGTAVMQQHFGCQPGWLWGFGFQALAPGLGSKPWLLCPWLFVLRDVHRQPGAKRLEFESSGLCTKPLQTPAVCVWEPA